MSLATPGISSFTSGEISPRLAGRIDLARYFTGCRTLENFLAHPHGGVMRRSGLRFIHETISQDKKSRLIPFEFNTKQTYVLEIGVNAEGRGRMRVFAAGGLCMSGGEPTQKMLEDHFGEGNVPDDFYIEAPIDHGWNDPCEARTPWKESMLDGLRWVQSNDVLIVVHPEMRPFRIERWQWNRWRVVPIDFTSMPEAWNSSDGWPGTVTFHQSRLVFGGTPKKPNTLWFSRTASYYDMTLKSTSENEPPAEDDAIEVTLDAPQTNRIMFMVPRRLLYVGTTGGEWTLDSAGSGPITPSTVMARMESSHGSADIQAEFIGNAAIYVQRAGRKLRAMTYSFESDSHASTDLTVFAEHITGEGVKAIAYSREPDPVLWCVRSDGELLSFTYLPEHEVMAWARHPTMGEVEAITSVYDHPSREDRLWVVIIRDVGGRSRRLVERLDPGFAGEAEQAFFVDSGCSYEGEPAKVLTGLGHLVGEKVDVLADGAPHRPLVVDEDGSITLDRAASVIHAGLPYRSVLQPMPLEAGSHRGTAQSKRKRVISTAVRFHETLGGSIGPGMSAMEPVQFPHRRMDQAPPLFSGDRRVSFRKGWDREAVLTVAQEQPLPMTVLMMVPEVAVYE